MAFLPNSNSACLRRYSVVEALWARSEEVRSIVSIQLHQFVPLRFTDKVHLTSYLAIVTDHVVLFIENHSSCSVLADANPLTHGRFTRSWLKKVGTNMGSTSVMHLHELPDYP